MESTGVEGRARRGPRVSDLLILIGASAFGLVWIRAWAGATPIYDEFLWIVPEAEPHSWLLRPAFYLRRWLLPVLGPLSLGVLILWLRPPRPPRAELLSRPGMLACLIASAVTLAQWGIAAAFGALTGTSAWWYIESRVFYEKGAAGMAVATGWILLALLGRWRPSSGWRDRAGRLIGAAWIAVWVASMALIFYPRYAPVPAGWNPPAVAGDDAPGDDSRSESHRPGGHRRDAEAPIDAAGSSPLQLPQSPDPPEDER